MVATTLDVLCSSCCGVLKAVSPKFEMLAHGFPTVKCVGIGTPINLIHVSAALPRVLVES
jgi:hypothetical protein